MRFPWKGGRTLHLDPLILSRLQFVWVVAWHILLPAFTVGLASFIAVMEGLHFVTGRESICASRSSGPRSSRSRSAWAWCPASSCRSSSAPTGAASPTRPPTSSRRCSAYEGLTAFFLEAAFLGVLLFGRKLVPPWAHFFAALMVAARHAVLDVLDPVRQQLDADAGGLRAGRRPVRARRTGWRSSSTRRSPTGSPTPSRRSTSPPASSCSASRACCCGAAASSRRRA